MSLNCNVTKAGIEPEMFQLKFIFAPRFKFKNPVLFLVDRTDFKYHKMLIF